MDERWSEVFQHFFDLAGGTESDLVERFECKPSNMKTFFICSISLSRFLFKALNDDLKWIKYKNTLNYLKKKDSMEYIIYTFSWFELSAMGVSDMKRKENCVEFMRNLAVKLWWTCAFDVKLVYKHCLVKKRPNQKLKMIIFMLFSLILVFYV